MKIIFFGLGSIGKKHAQLIRENFHHELFAFRSGKNKQKNELGIKEVHSLKELEKIKPDIAFITNPTSEHIKSAIYCAGKGIDLFIEKPLSDSKKGLARLEKIARQNKTRIYVAYCLRFHPAIQWLKKYFEKKTPLHLAVYSSSYLPDWRKGTDYLKRYSARKNMGGGVILDLSHEIDYVYYLLGDMRPDSIKANSKKISNVTIDSEDFADILIKSVNNVFCNVHLNFYSRLNRRELIADFTDETIICDLISSQITIKGAGTGKDKVIRFRNNMYLSQLNYFFNKTLKSRKGANISMNGLVESKKVFDILMQIKKEITP